MRRALLNSAYPMKVRLMKIQSTVSEMIRQVKSRNDLPLDGEYDKKRRYAKKQSESERNKESQ